MKKAIVIPLALLAFMPGLFAQPSNSSDTVQMEVTTGPVTLTPSQPASLSNASDNNVNISEFDSNGDGELSRREIPASDKLTHEFHLVDFNHNGFITGTELEKANWR